jgi:hypothetical protein
VFFERVEPVESVYGEIAYGKVHCEICADFADDAYFGYF